MTTQHVNITVNRISFPLKAPSHEIANLERAAKVVDAKIKAIATAGKIVGAEKIAVLAAVYLAYDLLQLQDEKHGNIHDMNKAIDALREKIQTSLASGEKQTVD